MDDLLQPSASMFILSPSEMSTNTSLVDQFIDHELCFYEPPPLTNERFWLVTVFGSTVSMISIIENLFLFSVFLTSKKHRSTYKLYLMLLAFFDVFVSAAYILLMSVNVLSDYLQSVILLRFWYSYMVPIITISHIAMTSSSFLILAATFERYCITLNKQFTSIAQNHRKMIAVWAIILGVISKGTMCLEFEITFLEECDGLMTEFTLGFHDFVMNTPYHIVWRFWYRNFVTIFMPFFCLAYLNIRIVKALSGNRELKQSAGIFDSVAMYELSRRKKIARSATRTLVCVVFTYLGSNILNVLLTVWEHLDKASLMTKYVKYYAIALDVISLLTNLASASRLPIYLSCEPVLRAEILQLIRGFRVNKWSRKSTKSTLEPSFTISKGNRRMTSNFENEKQELHPNTNESVMSCINRRNLITVANFEKPAPTNDDDGDLWNGEFKQHKESGINEAQKLLSFNDCELAADETLL